MILSHQKKFIFIHIYKVAGTSIRRVLDKYNDKQFSDFPVTDNLAFWIGNRFNMLSQFSIDHIKAIEIQKKIKPELFNNYFKFSFVRNPWDWQVSLYHYMLQDRTHRQHRLIKQMTSFDDYINWRVNHDIELQKDFLFDKRGNFIADYVGRFENLQTDFSYICNELKINTPDLPKINQSKHHYYKEYYTDKTKDRIYHAFKEDIKLFQYEY